MRREWRKLRTNLATAPSNCAAATTVRICLCACVAVVVGRTPLRTWHRVPLQSSIAYVLRSSQYAPDDLTIHPKFFVGHALSHGALATGLGRNPTQSLVDTRVNDSWWVHHQSSEEQVNAQEKSKSFGHCCCFCHSCVSFSLYSYCCFARI